MFSKASKRSAEQLLEILNIYSRGSGQLVNNEKSAVFFSKNCDVEVKDAVKSILHINTEALAEKYLGLPTALGRVMSKAFEYMPTRIRNLVGAWSGKEASCAGREVLLKSVAQAVPTYPMSCFFIPKDTCEKMESAISNYWWGGSASSRHIHWQWWELLTRPKPLGGMGFRDLRLFNMAMLGKQGWRLIEKPNSLWPKVLKGRYFHDSDFLSATRKKHASQTWRAIVAGREVLKKGLIRRVDDGNSARIWQDRWIPNHFGGKPITSGQNEPVTMVADLLTPSGAWNVELIKHVFVEVDAHAILSTPVRGRGEDVWAWEPERCGLYTVKSGYILLYDDQCKQVEEHRASSSSDITWSRIWKINAPPKMGVSWWRVVNGFLPTRGELYRRHIEPIPVL